MSETRDWAESMLESLEAFYGQKYDRQHWNTYVAVVRQQPKHLAQDAFNLLLRNWPAEKRLPPVAAVVQAFGKVQEAEDTTRDARRSLPMTEEEVSRLQTLLGRAKRMEPVYHDPELYASYLDMLRQVQAGKMTPEQAREAEEALLAEATEKLEAGKASVAAAQASDWEPPF